MHAVRLLSALVGAAIAFHAPACLAVEVAAALGLGAPTGRFQGYDTKVGLGPNVGLSVEQRLGLVGLQGEVEAAFLEGEERSLAPNNPGTWEFTARQISVMLGPTFGLRRGWLDVSLHLPAGIFVSDGTGGLGYFDGPGVKDSLHLSGVAAGIELAAFATTSPVLNAGLVVGYTHRWAQQRDWLDRASYNRGFAMVALALRWSTSGAERPVTPPAPR